MGENRRKRNREDSADEKNIPRRKRSKTDSTDDETANTALRSAVPKGYKMMEKMGYKEGETLGKNANALKEPIKVKMRSKNKVFAQVSLLHAQQMTYRQPNRNLGNGKVRRRKISG